MTDSDPPLNDQTASQNKLAEDAGNPPTDAVPEQAEPSPAMSPDAEVVPVTEEHLRLAEALIFASAAPVTMRALSQVLPKNVEAGLVAAALRARYAGRGVELVEAGGGLQFRTAPDLAPHLRRVVQVPRRLPRVAMETLAIVAYHQPVTRPEIEEIRGASLSQQTLDALLEAALIMPRGRKETPGRPTLWGTTPAFLAQFGLKDLRDLPRREDLLVEPPTVFTPAAPRDEGSAGDEETGPNGEPGTVDKDTAEREDTAAAETPKQPD
jgi:segregation and condensation protein B